MVFAPLAFGSVEPWSRAILQAGSFLLAFFCAWLARCDQGNLASGTQLVGIMAVVLIGAVQSLNARPSSAPLVWYPFTADLQLTRRGLVDWLSRAAVLWGVARTVRSQAAIRRVFWMIFIVGFVVATAGILQKAQGNHFIYGLRPVAPRFTPFGPYYNYDNAASLMAMAALVGLSILASRAAPALRPEDRIKSADQFWAVQALIAFMICVLVWGIITSTSRTGVLSFMAGACLMAAFLTKVSRSGKKRAALLIAVLTMAGGFAAFLYYFPDDHRFTRISVELGIRFRTALYLAGLHMLRDWWPWGTGLGSFQNVYPAYQSAYVHGIVQHVHSDPLELFLDIGVLGFGAVFVALCAFCRGTLQEITTLSGRARFLQAGGFAALVAFMIQISVDFSSHIPGNMFIALVIGGCVGARPWNVEKTVPRFSPLARVLVMIGCLLLAVYAARPAIAVSSNPRNLNSNARHLQAGRPGESARAAHRGGFLYKERT